MEYNKRLFIKHNDKKVLHKVKKQWIVVSVALLGALGMSGLVKGQAHANVNNANREALDSYNLNHSYTSSINNHSYLVNPHYSDSTDQTNLKSLASVSSAKSNNVNSSSISLSSESMANNNSQNQSNSNPSVTRVNNVNNAGSSRSIPKTITTWAITNPNQYMKSVMQKANFDQKDQMTVKSLLSSPGVTSFAHQVLYHLTNPYVSHYLKASSNVLGTFPPLLKSIAYNSSNWPIYRGVAVNTLYGDLYPSYRNSTADEAVNSILKSDVIHTSTKNDVINSVGYIQSLFNNLANVTYSMGHYNDGMSYITVPNPALIGANNHSTGYTNSDPNNAMGFNDDSLFNPLFNQNYHYNDPEGACNDIQTILPHYNNGKIDYWNVYYLWNPNSNWIGDQWYHAKTKDFVHFYPGVDPNDPASIQNAAIPDPDFRYNGSTVNANNPKAGPEAGPSIELDDNNKTNPVPWGQVATGSVVHNNDINPNGILHRDQWGNPIAPNAKLAYFSTFVDQTVPDDGIYLAYSNNDQQFHPYQSRPIMSTDTVNLPNGANFRDTYVTTANHNSELVAYVAGSSRSNKPEIYVLTSTNGTQWNWRHNLAMPIGPYLSNSTNNPNIITIDETPHIGQLNGQPVLFFGYQHQLAGGQSTGTKKDEGMAYLTGHFNSEGIFQLNSLRSDPFRYLDQGFDNYAGSIVPVGDNAVYLGWLGNWGYSPILDYSAYSKGGMHQGTFTLPRIFSWNANEHRVNAYPIEPGNEQLIEKASLQDSNSQIPVTSNGKTSIEFNGPVSHFQVKLSRSDSNYLNVEFNNGQLTINRSDNINPEMDMKKVINNIDTDKLDNVQFYLDNDSIEMYIPAVRKFYTILDLDYRRNNPYQIRTDQPSKVTEYGFTKQQPNFVSGLNTSNESRLAKLNVQNGSQSVSSSIKRNIQNDLNNAHQYSTQAKQANGVEANVYTAYANDYEYDADEELDQYANQLAIKSNPSENISKLSNASGVLIGKNGKLYYYDRNGQSYKNQVLSISPNLQIRFNNAGEGTYFYAQPSSQPAGGKLQPGYGLFSQLLTLINDKIKGNPVDEAVFTDLLQRINTNNLPNLETGVPGIPLTANVLSTDCQSPFLKQLLHKLSQDFDTLGNDLNINMFSQVGNLLSNSLLNNLYWIGVIAGGPINFERVINNLLPNSNFKALQPYEPYIKAAETVYNNPKSISAYNDMLGHFHDLLEENSPVSQANTMKQIYDDIDVIGATPGLADNVRDYCLNLLQLDGDETNLNNDSAEVADITSSNIMADPAVASMFNGYQNEINGDMSMIAIDSSAAMSDSGKMSQINSALSAVNSAASAAEQEVPAASSAASESSKASSERIANSQSYSAIYSAEYEASYVQSVINGLKFSGDSATTSAMAYDRYELTSNVDQIDSDFNSLNVGDAIQQATSASQTASRAYNMYCTVSAASASSAMNHMSKSEISANYKKIYSDFATTTYDNTDFIRPYASKLANRSSALSQIDQSSLTLSEVTSAIKSDFNQPTSSALSNANAELSLANQATASAYNVYESAINSQSNARYNTAYADYYAAGYDNKMVTSMSNGTASQQAANPRVASMIQADQSLINYASQQIASELQHGISKSNLDKINEYMQSIRNATNHVYSLCFKLTH